MALPSEKTFRAKGIWLLGATATSPRDAACKDSPWQHPQEQPLPQEQLLFPHPQPLLQEQLSFPHPQEQPFPLPQLLFPQPQEQPLPHPQPLLQPPLHPPQLGQSSPQP